MKKTRKVSRRCLRRFGKSCFKKFSTFSCGKSLIHLEKLFFASPLKGVTRRKKSPRELLTWEDALPGAHDVIVAANLHAQVNHQEHGDVHHDALDEERKLVAFGKPEKHKLDWINVWIYKVNIHFRGGSCNQIGNENCRKAERRGEQRKFFY